MFSCYAMKLKGRDYKYYKTTRLTPNASQMLPNASDYMSMIDRHEDLGKDYERIKKSVNPNLFPQSFSKALNWGDEFY